MAKYELARLVSYERDSLLSELKRVSAAVPEGPLTAQVFNRLARCSSSAIRRHFGSWEAALAAAGLHSRFSGGVGGRGSHQRVYSDEEILTELKAAAKHNEGRPLTMQDFRRHGTLNPETIRRRYGSWGKALKSAGLQVAKLGRRYSEEDYYENLLAVWTHYGRQPTYGEMDRPPSTIPSGAYETKWKTWRKALLTFIQLAECRPAVSPSSSTSTTSESQSDKHTTAKRSPRRQVATERRSDANVVDDSRTIPLRLRYQVLSRDSFRCSICGASPATQYGCQLHVDHVVPVSRGGKSVLENLRTLCAQCNLGKGATVEKPASQTDPT